MDLIGALEWVVITSRTSQTSPWSDGVPFSSPNKMRLKLKDGDIRQICSERYSIAIYMYIYIYV